MVVKAKAKTKAAKPKAAKPKAAKPAVVKKEKPKTARYEEASTARYITCIAGFILVALSLLLSGILYLECFFNGNGTVLNEGLYNLTLWGDRVIGVCLFVVMLYGFYNKIYAESVFFLIFSMLILFVSIGGDGITESAMTVVDVLGGILLLIPALMFVAKKEILLFLAAFLHIFGCIVCECCNAPGDQAIYSIPTLVAAVLFLYIAIAYFVKAETGKTIPLI